MFVWAKIRTWDLWSIYMGWFSPYEVGIGLKRRLRWALHNLWLWGKFRLDKHSCFDKQIRILIQKICHSIVSNNTWRVISAVQKWGKFFNFEKKMCGDQHTYRVQCKKMLHTWHILALWQYGLCSFLGRDTKLESFLPMNQHTQRKLMNFEFWINGELSKIGHHFSN